MGSISSVDVQSEATTTTTTTPATTAEVTPGSGSIDTPGLIETVTDAVAETLAEAAGSPVPVAELHGGHGDPENNTSEYWNASSMAPLNAVSAVSHLL